MSTQVRFTGDQACDQPGLGLTWQPGDEKTLRDEVAARLCVAENPFEVVPVAVPVPGPSESVATAEAQLAADQARLASLQAEQVPPTTPSAAT